ncbi:hypothetical protein BH10BDE1_BH10BDE1_16780 [soil metagenome]
MKKLLIGSMVWIGTSLSAYADIPTPQEACEQSRWATCQTVSGGYIGEEGPCPDGTTTIKAYDPNKDCSPVAIATAESGAKKTNAPTARIETTPVHDMAKIPWTAYIPFFLFGGVLLFIVGYGLRQQLRNGKNPFFVIGKLVVQGISAIGGGLLGTRWAFGVGNSMVQNHDTIVGGLLGLGMGIVGFCLFGSVTLVIVTFIFARIFKRA